MGLQVAAANKIINEFAGLAFAGGEFETDNPAIRFVSAEAWTRDAQGAHIVFATAPIGSSSPVEGMRLTSEGILLVGTDTASGSAKLQVSGAISVSGITYAGTLALSATGANPITFSSGGTEGFRLAPTTRNLLVGTTTDDSANKLQVAGRVKITEASNSRLVFQNDAAGSTYQSMIQWNNKTGTAQFYQGLDPNNSGVSVYQILSSGGSAFLSYFQTGNVSIGTTSTTDPNYKLDVAASGSSGTLRVYDQTATTGSTSLVVRAGEGQAGDIFQVVSNAGSVFMRVLLDGTIGISTKTPASAVASGTAGQVCWDASYIYVCTAANTWKRVAIATW